MDASLVRRCLAELVGTTLLVLFGAGSVVAALTINDGALGYPALGFIALAFGLVVALAVYTLGTTSGAHINPAVTIGLAVVRRFSWKEVGPYIAAQAAGALVGALLIVAYVGDRATELGATGLTALGEGVHPIQGVVAEIVGTFLLVFTVMAVAVDKRAPTGWSGYLIGLAVTTAILVIGPFTGASINPARSFGPYLVNEVFGGATPWADFWVYLVGPVVGGALAALCYELLARPGKVQPIGHSDGEKEDEGASSTTAAPTEGEPEQPHRGTHARPRAKSDPPSRVPDQ